MTMSEQNDPKEHREHWHRRWLENRLGLFTIATTVAISIGGLVEIVPMFTVKAGPPALEGVTPFTPLEIAGRDIYVREGCYTCHSQMIRPMRAEMLRYGEWSRAGEYAYEHPFQLGSRRIGPDLHRVGGKYPDAWHYEHMRDPRSTSPGSSMPAYTWLLRNRLDPKDVQASVRALSRVGVPYSAEEIASVPLQIAEQGDMIVRSLASMGIETERNREIIALIAYLQRLGVDGKEAIELQKQALPTDAVAAGETR
jgi:cytochrome c oxidase cbb3-type subunit I/II